MNASVNTLPAAAANTKPLWAAVTVLGVAVVALGASLVYVQSRPVDGHAALAALNSMPAAAPVESTAAKVQVPESLAPKEDLVAPSTPLPPPVNRPQTAKVVKPSARAATPVAAPGPAQAPEPPAGVAQAPSPAPVAVAAGGGAPYVVTESGVVPSQPAPVVQRPVCAQCGTVESVTPVQRTAKSGSGVGVVAGGALGAVVGNQIGKGGGRTLATILGAVGGGLAGNAIEKNMKKETVYQVQVRMEDGSLRTLEQPNPATIGARVTLEGGTLHPVDQRATAPALPKPVTPTFNLPGAGDRA